MAKLNPDFYTVWNYRKDYLSLQINKEDGLLTFLAVSRLVPKTKRRKCWGRN